MRSRIVAFSSYLMIQKWTVECGAAGLVPMFFPIFHSTCLKYSFPPKSDAKSYKVLQLSAKIIYLIKPNNLMLQNAAHLKKSTPGPPNISDSCLLYCAYYATCMLHTDPPLMSVACARFWTCCKTFWFCSFLARFRFACACHTKRRLNVQKMSEHAGCFYHF